VTQRKKQGDITLSQIIQIYLIMGDNSCEIKNVTITCVVLTKDDDSLPILYLNVTLFTQMKENINSQEHQCIQMLLFSCYQRVGFFFAFAIIKT